MKNESPLLTINSIGITLGKKEVLKDISFSLKRGEIICLLGNNGTGKSTILRCSAGLLIPDKGKIYLQNKDISSLSDAHRARTLAWCPQNSPTAFGFTAIEYVALANEWKRFVQGMSQPSEIETRLYMECLREFDAQHLAHVDISVLSGGEWKRVQLARVWAQKTKLLILDEPSTGLDLKHISLLRNKCQEYVANTHGSILFSTHDISLALNLASRIILIDNGIVVFDLPTLSVINNEVLEQTFAVRFNWHQESDGTIYVSPKL